MRRSLQVTSAVAATTVLGAAGYQLLAARRARTQPVTGRRHVVTVYRTLDEVRDNLPEVLNDRGGAVVVELREAPAGRGTEISVHAPGGAVPDGDLRHALRDARALLEAGEILRPGGPTTEPTPLNKPLRAVTRRGREGGLL
jgi:hypothetical protein